MNCVPQSCCYWDESSSSLLQYSQCADNQHYHWAAPLLHLLMMEEYSCLTAAPLPNCCRHVSLGLRAAVCHLSFVSGVITLQTFHFLHAMQNLSQAVVFLHECFFCSTTLHNVSQTHLRLVRSHPPCVTLCSTHISW